ncbi:hypothetical protein BDW67DRAFT_189159 [Aspergillus spinulosporus]
MSDNDFWTTINLDLTGTILGPDSGYCQDTVHIKLDTVALNDITERVKRNLTEANLIRGGTAVFLKFEDVVMHVSPPPKAKTSHEVLKSLKAGDRVRQFSTLQVQYKFRGEHVCIEYIQLDMEGLIDG